MQSGAEFGFSGHAKRSFPAGSEGVILPVGDIAQPWDFLD
jgi:hypothetical protein